jgi:hypothetical protein
MEGVLGGDDVNYHQGLVLSLDRVRLALVPNSRSLFTRYRLVRVVVSISLHQRYGRPDENTHRLRFC